LIFTSVSSQHHSGNSALYVEGGNHVNDGAQYAVTLGDSSFYTASFFVRFSPGDFNSPTIVAGYSSDGSTDNTACTQNTPTVSSSGWTRITCYFQTPASHSGSPYFYMKQTDASTRDMFFDDVILEPDSSNTPDPSNGSVDLQGPISSPLAVQGSSNSTSAFSVLNKDGNAIMNIDTTDPTNMITNPSFEQSDAGWIGIGSGISTSQDPSQAAFGRWSQKVVSGTTANSGTKFTTGTSQPTVLAINTTYTLSWYSKLSSGTFTDIKGRYTRNGASFVECIPSNQTVITTGWTRFSCTFTTDGTAPTGSAAVEIVQTGIASGHTYWIDGARLELGSTATAYGNGAVSLDALITSQLNLRNTSDSTTAFQIQNASGAVALNVDTTTTTITMGNGGNTLSFTPSGGIVAAGTARHTKTLLLTPEYAGGVLDALGDASCSAAFSGTMTSAYDGTNRMNNYNWTSASGSAQCYDVVVQVPIPNDFSAWSGNPDIEMQKDSTGTAAYALQIVPSSGTDANYNSFATAHNTITTSWSNMANNPLSGTYTAGDYMTIKVRMTSTSGANVKLGNIKLVYLSTF
jgi:hypothetical protein